MRLTNEQWEKLDTVIDKWLFAFESGNVNRDRLEDFSLSVLAEFLPPLTIGHVDNRSSLGTLRLLEEFDNYLTRFQRPPNNITIRMQDE